MSDKVLLSKRQFLNPKNSSDSGIIQTMVSVDSYGVESSVSIWDCSRKIVLDLSCYSRESSEERAEKIQLLIIHLQDVQKAMGEAFAIAEKEGVFDEECN